MELVREARSADEPQNNLWNAKFIESVAISACDEWVPEKLDVIEVCQIKPEWRRRVGDQATSEHLAS